ncbi:cytochrome c [Massilia sp. LC238]|uniref:cytochrome c n=1 Tax=Massilia sp. LC238 TaxID=1502852 RepID=UPI0004E32C3B|nr:cytochrome c [Massilia sp. LC238]KFC65943.1 putative cytochrome c [Massilia sp. LC238]
MISPLHKACAAAVLLALAMPAVQAAQNNPHQPAANATAQGKYIERGRYLVKVGGCNDCHTAGYGMSAGKVPEKDWLQGDQLGWRGPWGTTYPTNLRLSMNALGEDEWIRMAQTMQARPPMPWFTLHQMDKEDLRAIHRFVRHLGPAGKPAPAALAPGVAPKGPAILFPAPPGK